MIKAHPSSFLPTSSRLNRRAFLAAAGATLGLGPLTTVGAEGEATERSGPQARGQVIELPEPSKQGGRPLNDVLRERATRRDFSETPLEEQVMADLLWAAFGVNRTETGQRTAPSAMDLREIDVYVAVKHGLFRYAAESHQLVRERDDDIRAMTGGQAYVRVAPVSLLYVVDFRKQERVPERERLFYAAADTGFIGQNVYLYCASERLASVVHVVPRPETLAQELGLNAAQRVVLAQCVGYPA